MLRAGYHRSSLAGQRVENLQRKTGKPKGIIPIAEYNGVLIGKIGDFLEGAPSRLAMRARTNRKAGY